MSDNFIPVMIDPEPEATISPADLTRIAKQYADATKLKAPPLDVITLRDADATAYLAIVVSSDEATELFSRMSGKPGKASIDPYGQFFEQAGEPDGAIRSIIISHTGNVVVANVLFECSAGRRLATLSRIFHGLLLFQAAHERDEAVLLLVERELLASKGTAVNQTMIPVEILDTTAADPSRTTRFDADTALFPIDPLGLHHGPANE